LKLLYRKDLNIVSDLLEIDKEKLRDGLITRTTTTRGEKFVTPLTVEQVSYNILFKKWFIFLLFFLIYNIYNLIFKNLKNRPLIPEML